MFGHAEALFDIVFADEARLRAVFHGPVEEAKARVSRKACSTTNG